MCLPLGSYDGGKSIFLDSFFLHFSVFPIAFCVSIGDGRFFSQIVGISTIFLPFLFFTFAKPLLTTVRLCWRLHLANDSLNFRFFSSANCLEHAQQPFDELLRSVDANCGFKPTTSHWQLCDTCKQFSCTFLTHFQRDYAKKKDPPRKSDCGCR